MSEATAAVQEQPQMMRKVIFASRFREQVLTMKPSKNKLESGTGAVMPGKHIQFKDHKYETSDPREIEFIKARADDNDPTCPIKMIEDAYFCMEPGCNASFPTKEMLNGHMTKHRKQANK